MFKFNLRDKVKDTILDYEGTITYRCEYIDRENLYCVESIDNTGRPIEWNISESRLTLIEG